MLLLVLAIAGFYLVLSLSYCNILLYEHHVEFQHSLAKKFGTLSIPVISSYSFS